MMWKIYDHYIPSLQDYYSAWRINAQTHALSTCWHRCQRITGKRVGEARWSLAALLEEGRLLFQTHTVLRKYCFVEKTSVGNIEDESCVEPQKADWYLTLVSRIGEMAPPTGKPRVASIHRQDPTNRVSGRNHSTIHWACHRKLLCAILFLSGRPS